MYSEVDKVRMADKIEDRLIGKFLVGKHETVNGNPVTIVCGVVEGHHIVDNDNHNAVLAELFLGEHRIVKTKMVEDMSPEDFLEHGINNIDWSKNNE